MMLTKMITLRNPKNGDTLETRFTPDETIDILRPLTSNRFAQSLVTSYDKGGLSPAQWFWAHKLAHENHTSENKSIPLPDNIHKYLLDAKLTRLMWRFKSEDGVLKPRIKLYIKSEEIDVVYSGGDFSRRIGRIVGDQFYPIRSNSNFKTPKTAILQLIVFASLKMEFMQAYGREFGVCFICGRELENEESVKLGIGPICRERF